MGLHTGLEVKMTFCPAKEDTGIVFQRTDLPGHPIIPAKIEYVQDTSRSTSIGIGNVRIHTVEHVLAALYAYNIDNLIIQVSSAEPPVGDGSSMPFVEMIESAKVKPQNAMKEVIKLLLPLYFSKGEIHLVAIPSDEYRVSYTLHYPQSKAIKCQYISLPINQTTFKEEIASSRTFALYEEVSQLMDRGLIKGGSLENAVVIKDDVIFSKEGLRFQDEMVRHKILDLVGDLSLVGSPILAHVIAVRSGHSANTAFAQEIINFVTEGNG